ncbi:MAG: hypothetical protein JNK31_00765 [Candidatus Competibacter sp.]|nr:hypothetical protein [Candidatus Competibacter sp.]
MNPLHTKQHLALLLLYIVSLAALFAMVEIQIEGGQGWASGLPTWRIEAHWLLDVFWGGRPMTGYHAWVFPFMLLAFHLPLVLTGAFSWRLEARCLGSVMLFWVIEDACWFLFNPAFGSAGLIPDRVPWHKHWWFGLPSDYYLFGLAGLGLVGISYRQR